MRFLMVLALLVGAAWSAGQAVRDASTTMWIVAGALVLVALIVSVSGGKKRKARKAAAAAATAAALQTAAPVPAPVTPSLEIPAELPVDVPALAQDADAGVSDLVLPEETPALVDDADVAADEAAAETSPLAPAPVEAPVVEAEATSAESAPSVRTPFSVQPAVVLMSFYDAVAERYRADCAHLWLEDSSTSTLRLVAAFGPKVPAPEPVTLEDPILGVSASTRTAVFEPLEPVYPDPPTDVWRYAVPVGTPEVRGVAAIDLAVQDPSAAARILNEISGQLRGSLTASLAVHVARSEMETAVLLLRAAQEFTSGMDGDDILSAALERAMELSGATTGSVMMPGGADGHLRIVASRGLPSDIVASASVASGEGIAGTVYSTSAPLLVEDLPGRAGESRHGVHSSVSVPISDEKGTIGVINVGARAFPARLTDAYVRALGLLGSQTAVAMRTNRVAEQSWDGYLDNLQALASALEFDDPCRRGASRRTADLTVALGQEMGLSDEELVSLRIAAILHDVGMGMATGSVGASDRPLSTVDRGLVRSHPKLASDVLAQVPSLESLAPVVRHHHERFDGDGYDTGLSGRSIPLGSRILAVTDSFVAMTSTRPYRSALPVESALAELNAGSGGQYDPEVVESFIGLLARHPELAGA